ncbi:MAG: DUF5723 family protein [Bacteroidota bacterium]
MRGGAGLLLGALWFAAPCRLPGGEHADIRGVGMAGSSAAGAIGLDGAGMNPARLAWTDGGSAEISLLPCGVRVGSEFLDYALYRDWFTGGEEGRRHLNEEAKRAILASFHGDWASAHAEAELRLFGAACRLPEAGWAAFTVTDHAAGRALVPREYAALLLYGNAAGSDSDVEGARMQAEWLREYALTWAFRTGEGVEGDSWGFGVTLKYLHGFGYYETERFSTLLETDVHGTLTGGVDFRSRSAGAPFPAGGYPLFPAPAGDGWGLDLGVAADLSDIWSVGAALTDIGAVVWRHGAGSWTADTSLVLDDLLDETQVRAVESVLRGRREEGGPFAVPLPACLRLGAEVRLHRVGAFRWMGGELRAEMDYHQGLRSTARSVTIPRVSMGLEYIPAAWCALRCGLAAGGSDGLGVAGGLGIRAGVLEVNIASGTLAWLAQPGSFSHGSLAAGIRLRW